MSSSRRIRILVAVLALVGLGTVALLAGPSLFAQDPELKASYGEVELKADFQPDPHVVKVVAGGPLEIDKGGFKHFIGKAPDFRLIYQAGKYPLFIRADSKDDTTLLIKTPDGTWIVDDDSGGGNNPMIKLANPKSGRYEIWVGTIEKGPTPACNAVDLRDQVTKKLHAVGSTDKLCESPGPSAPTYEMTSSHVTGLATIAAPG